MAIDRREFLLTTLSTTLSSYLVSRDVPPQEIEGKKIVHRDGTVALCEDNTVHHLDPEMDHFTIGKGCVFGLIDDGKPICRLLGEQVQVSFPIDAKVWQQSPSMIKIGRFVGFYDDMAEFYRRTSNIANKSKMWFAVDPLYGDVNPKLAFVLDRPVLTSVGITASTPTKSFDATTENRPSSGRMSISENVQIMCADVPEQMEDFVIPTPRDH